MKNYVLVGTGSRGTYAYVLPITQQYSDCAKLVGLYDINATRARMAAAEAAYEIPVFEDFDEMLKATRPDTVIVTSMDSTHDYYIVKALDFGCDVISEKPITTTAEKFKAIWEAEQRSGKKVTTTFNCRFMPNFVRVKELVKDGEIGDILSVHYQWLLDQDHGASYFRRWNRKFECSGSLLVHKSSHHFDLLNWFLDDEPEKINAFGSLKFYGPNRAERGEKCSTCAYKDKCEFFFDLGANPERKKLYIDSYEPCDYTREGCVFSDEINIPDSASVNIRYKKGTVVSYTLHTYSPYEGVRLTLNGTKGRLELAVNSSGEEVGATITIFNAEGEKRVITPPKKESRGHGSGDIRLFNFLFRGDGMEDPLGQLADSRAGAMSIGIGIAATTSMKEDRAIYFKELFEYL